MTPAAATAARDPDPDSPPPPPSPSVAAISVPVLVHACEEGQLAEGSVQLLARRREVLLDACVRRRHRRRRGGDRKFEERLETSRKSWILALADARCSSTARAAKGRQLIRKLEICWKSLDSGSRVRGVP